MGEYGAAREPERSNGGGTGEPLTRNEMSGEAQSVVQAGSIGELHLHNPPSRPPSVEIPVAITCEVEADYVIQRDWSDGVPLSGGLVRVFVEACEDRAVLLRAMRPLVIARRPPLGGTETMHWGIPEVRKYSLNLDKDPPRLKGPKFLYTVSPGDPEVFELTVHCGPHDIDWRLEVDWTCAGRTGTSVVDLGGHPFRFTARPGTRRWPFGTRR
ncbi:hypothetical protein KV205_14770 [Streptomyces sp. SKN60]|uniref:hypothetical protein n=1 Tax=Streptomyces sp. SKN60 TaxID=2855506 RepID=UPI002246FE03|nr:hypothetical protein [Streptomyces sp. SKN60]MCX2181786.1 hypothetical protein [Streptomyces sp. SKN60]